MGPGESTIIAANGHGVGGYLWSAHVAEGHCQILRHEITSGGPAIGGGALIEFHIANVTSNCVVVLTFKRPWETSVAQQVAVHLVRE